MRRRHKRTPKLPKTFEEVMALKDKDLHETSQFGIVIELYDTVEDTRITLQELMDKFYRIHLAQPTAYWGKKRPTHETAKPAVFLLKEDEMQGISTKHWLGIFRGNFYVIINPNYTSKPGPHRAELWFQSFSTRQSFWIATLQIMAFFYNEKEMLEALMKCIEEKEWFITPDDAKRSIIP